jgi:acetyltransferase-like isoleucine patch superfamily enzyme
MLGLDRSAAAAAWLGLTERAQSWYRTTLYRSLTISHPTSLFYGTARVLNPRRNPALINIGKHTRIRGELFCFAHGGAIDIGSWCFIGEQSRVWSAKRISIGDRVLIAHSVNIHDTISHPILARERFEHTKAIITDGHPENVDFDSAEVSICDDVWIGFGATVLRGVTIGRGAIIGAATIITKDVPAWSIVAGNPARVIRELTPDDNWNQD